MAETLPPASARADAPVGRYAQTNVQLLEQLRRSGTEPGELARVGRAWQLAARLLAGRFRCSGRPFLCHLAGTASVLAAHRAEPDTVRAGLLHAVYTHGDFGDGTPGATPARRRDVAGAAGEAVEDLVHRYAAERWRGVPWEEAAGRAACGEERERAVLLLRAANALEETLDGNLAYSSPAKRALLDEELPRAVAVARALGRAALARELEAARARGGEREPGPPRVAFGRAPAVRAE